MKQPKMLPEKIPELEIVNIDKIDQCLLKGFDCASPNSSMTEFLHEAAVEYHKIGEGKTTVVVDKDLNRIIGYFTIKCSSLQLESVNSDNKSIMRVFPAVEIARFAIDKNYQGKKFSNLVFLLALRKITLIKDDWVGVRAVLLFALPEPKVIHFYSKYGFNFLDSDERLTAYQSKENTACLPMYHILKSS